MVEVSDTLADRETKYGSFEDVAGTAQDLKRIIRVFSHRLTPVQVEALEMIMTKIARLLHGDPAYRDTVLDIVGYSELMLRSMK